MCAPNNFCALPEDLRAFLQAVFGDVNEEEEGGQEENLGQRDAPNSTADDDVEGACNERGVTPEQDKSIDTQKYFVTETPNPKSKTIKIYKVHGVPKGGSHDVHVDLSMADFEFWRKKGGYKEVWWEWEKKGGKFMKAEDLIFDIEFFFGVTLIPKECCFFYHELLSIHLGLSMFTYRFGMDQNPKLKFSDKFVWSDVMMPKCSRGHPPALPRLMGGHRSDELKKWKYHPTELIKRNTVAAVYKEKGSKVVPMASDADTGSVHIYDCNRFWGRKTRDCNSSASFFVHELAHLFFSESEKILDKQKWRSDIPILEWQRRFAWWNVREAEAKKLAKGIDDEKKIMEVYKGKLYTTGSYHWGGYSYSVKKWKKILQARTKEIDKGWKVEDWGEAEKIIWAYPLNPYAAKAVTEHIAEAVRYYCFGPNSAYLIFQTVLSGIGLPLGVVCESVEVLKDRFEWHKTMQCVHDILRPFIKKELDLQATGHATEMRAQKKKTKE
mmetsp:Transcript_42868/g.108242  ORF Transcript_42868/g.108242 Transcript_42868/m.108242 type:complete len:496 (+) Transcript_42868:90-1577(+)